MCWQIANTACLLMLVCCTGCATVTPPTRFQLPSFLKRSRVENSEEAETIPDIERNAVLPKLAAPPKRQPLIARNFDRISIPTHSPETQELIETELADASPGERREWLDYLATVDAAMVPYALKSRRFKNGKAIPEANTFGEDRSSKSGAVVTASIATTQSASDSPATVQPTSSLPIQPGHTPASVPTVEQGIELASSESTVTTSPAEIEERDWSGRLKSLTEWENNPLNFSREDPAASESGTKDRRSKTLPRMIANPFQKETSRPEQTPATQTQPLLFEDVDSTPLSVPNPDSLRITPGAKLWEEELHKLVSLMEAEATASGRQNTGTLSRNELRQQVALRMLYLVSEQTELAMTPIPGLQTADQEFWTALFWGLSEYLNQTGIDPAERSTKTMEQFRSATHYLQIASKLQLRNVCFCSRIHGFGSFETFPSNQFSPGQPVLIYCDIRNFQSESDESAEYVTKLRSSIEIYKGSLNGPLVERNPFPATKDRCRTLRTDYYHSYRIDLPELISPGKHLLKLSVHDELSGKSATEVLEFTIR